MVESGTVTKQQGAMKNGMYFAEKNNYADRVDVRVDQVCGFWNFGGDAT